MKKLVLLSSFAILSLAIFSQEVTTAPSMQVGLSGIRLSKGTFDSELLAQIIAEKQQEIKVRLVKNMLLKRLGVNNGLFYAYLDNTIDIITKEKNESVRVKNLLENTVNLAFVVTYAEYYLRTLKWRDSTEWRNFMNLASVYGYDSHIFNDHSPLSLLRFSRIKYDQSGNVEKDTLANYFIPVLLDMFAEVVRQNEDLKKIGLMRTCYFQNYSNLNAYLNLSKDDNQFHEGKLFFIDYSEKNKPNEDTLMKILSDSNITTLPQFNIAKKILDELKKEIDEFFEINKKKLSDQDWQIYSIQKRNFEQYIIEDYPGDTLANRLAQMKNSYSNYKRFIKEFLNQKEYAKKVYDDIKTNLATYVKYAGLIKSLSQKGSYNDDTPIDTIFKLLDKSFPCNTVSSYQHLTQMLKEATDESKLFYRSDEDLHNLLAAQSFLEKVKYFNLNPYDFLAEFDKTVKPALNSLGKYSTKFLDLRDSLNTNINCIIKNVGSDLNLKKLHIDFNSPFISLLGSLNAFDEVETYSKFLNQLSDAGDVFNDEGMRATINIIISFIRGYIKVEKDDKTNETILTLDVESFLAHLQRLPYNKFRSVELLFTLGANTASFSKPYFVDSSNTIRNYSYLGEKIGIKWKIIDWAYLNSFSRGDVFKYYCKDYKRLFPPKEPTISNLHLLFYGSGILYNLVNTGTTRAFNDPIVAAGIGLSFYNDLDVNLSVGKPISPNYNFFSNQLPTIYNIGFDIQFFEYADRLNQKRLAKKNEKIIQQSRALEANK